VRAKHICGILAALLLAAALAMARAQNPGPLPTQQRPGETGNPTPTDPARFDPKRPIEQEVRTSVRDGFTLGAVGDCIISRPLSQYAERDEPFATILKILGQSTALYGNMETSILDIRGFKGYPFSWAGDWTLRAEPDVARDLAKMGFRVMSRANNHAEDWGIEGMRETSQWLDAAGITHAGSGEDLGIARMARYFESSKGRVAIVSMASTYRPESGALAPLGATPGRPGISGLRLRQIAVVPADVMAALAKMQPELVALHEERPAKQKADGKAPSGPPAKLSMFGQDFELGEKTGYRYEMDQTDLADILKSIRLGKEHSDFLVATIHSHECSTCDPPALPAGFLRDLSHAAIRAGADAFVTTGIHHLGPIEVYEGRPVFYGLANFFWSDIQEPLPADLYQRNREKLEKAFQFPGRATDADLSNVLNVGSFSNDETFETIVAQSRFEHGRLAELRLYPVDLGYGLKLTESGIPRLASAEKGLKILNRLQALSAPYGTTILIEDTTEFRKVGVIRVAVQ
jgi:poly-gamma-glutamate capsule biosynthesis protein CapA/YwtB (metallophosphatase superfamily)